ncbi:unnamed protein product, partial [Discosporangium mesarthrocarpum]
SRRRPTHAEAAELLRRRSSIEEVIGLLSAPTGDGPEDNVPSPPADPMQYDTWRHSLTKVLGHLGFELEDEEDNYANPNLNRNIPSPSNPEASSASTSTSNTSTNTDTDTGMGDSCATRGTTHNPNPNGGGSTSGHGATDRPRRGTSQYLSWGGTSQMSFEEQPAEFQESLRQIPMRWRSSLSSIMNSMASNVSAASVREAESDGTTGIGFGKASTKSPSMREGSSKRISPQASLEMLRSAMQEGMQHSNMHTNMHKYESRPGASTARGGIKHEPKRGKMPTEGGADISDNIGDFQSGSKMEDKERFKDIPNDIDINGMQRVERDAGSIHVHPAGEGGSSDCSLMTDADLSRAGGPSGSGA